MAIGQKNYLAAQGVDTYDAIQCLAEWERPGGGRFTSAILTNWIDPEGTSAMSDQKIKVIGTMGRYEADQKRRGICLITDEAGIEEPNPDFSTCYGVAGNGPVSFRGYGIDSILQFLQDVRQIGDGSMAAGDLEGSRPTFRDALVPTLALEAANRSLALDGAWVQIATDPESWRGNPTMIHGQTITAMIPARMGSTRLARKNMALINGKPMIYYAIQASLDSGVFDRIVVNSEHPAFGRIARENGVTFYQRPKSLAGSSTKSDDVVDDFLCAHPGDITAWVNPTSPLQTGAEIRDVITHFCRERLDSLITVYEEQVHCLYDGRPLNFRTDEVFAQTQHLKTVQRFVYSVMMWRNEAFLAHYRKKGHAVLCGKIGYFPVSKASAMIVKTPDDLLLIQQIMAGRAMQQNPVIEYEDPL